MRAGVGVGRVAVWETGLVMGAVAAGESVMTLAMMSCSVWPLGTTALSSPQLNSQIRPAWASTTPVVTRQVRCFKKRNALLGSGARCMGFT